MSVLACGALACFAPPASAQGGGGLYEPFPEPVRNGRAESYVQQLGVKATEADLDHGRVLGAAARPEAAVAPAIDASRRAGVGSTSAVRLLTPLLAILLAAGLVDRRRWRA